MEQVENVIVEGVVTYQAQLIDSEWLANKPIEAAVLEPRVTKIIVEANDAKNKSLISINAHFQDDVRAEDAYALTIDAVRRVVNRIAKHLQTYITEPEFVTGVIITTTQRGIKSYSQLTYKIPKGPVSFHFGIYTHEVFTNEVQDVLQKHSLPGENLYEIYRQALSLSHPVARYMALYRILEMKYETQRGVDGFIIHARDGNVEYKRTQPPREYGQPTLKYEPPSIPLDSDKPDWKPETVYTRLRNELAHNRKDADLPSTFNDMRNHVHGLMRLVESCIETSDK